VRREPLSGFLKKCSVESRLLLAFKSFYSCSEVCVRANSNKSQPLTVGIGLRQWCVLLPLFFIVHMNWVDSHSRLKQEDQPFAFCEQFNTACILWTGLQHALLQLRLKKLEWKLPLTNRSAIILQKSKSASTVSKRQYIAVGLKFNYLRVLLTSDGRWNKEINTRIGKANAVQRELYRSVVTKLELSKTAKLSVFKTGLCSDPHLS